MSKKEKKLYALKAPDGVIEWDTISYMKQDVWRKSFAIVASYLGEVWKAKYWKRWAPSLASSRKHGFSIVRVKVVEVK